MIDVCCMCSSSVLYSMNWKDFILVVGTALKTRSVMLADWIIVWCQTAGCRGRKSGPGWWILLRKCCAEKLAEQQFLPFYISLSDWSVSQANMFLQQIGGEVRTYVLQWHNEWPQQISTTTISTTTTTTTITHHHGTEMTCNVWKFCWCF